MKAALLLSAALIAGCSVLGSSGPSAVAKGEYYPAGKPAFDSFFIQLYELQVALLSAPEEPKRARGELTRALGLGVEASDESLAQRLREEAQKLTQRGVRTRLEVPESTAADASATLHTSDASWSSPLRTALQSQATRLVRARNHMQDVQGRLERLRVTSIELEGNVDREFRVDGPWKRDEVRKNLSDSQKLVTLMLARAKEVQAQSAQLLLLLATAATTDASVGKSLATAPAPEEEAKPTRRAPRSTGLRPSSPPGSGRPAAAPPAAKPRSGDDEGAAPKPTQGSAPAEIEP